ncbi:MAG TPA: DNA repair protein RecO C-terminal domain-containing protein, partial [Gammaproteobacteria bacterium]|nr:DNA repair protein RecO C-terminal domain-containing protein [Gammaproteobacteria bacterium]
LFEFRLLGELGVGLQLDVDCETGRPLVAECTYAFSLDSGATRSDAAASILGAHLISLREQRLDDGPSLRAARVLLGEALARQLGSRRLRSRDVFRDIDARGLIA